MNSIIAKIFKNKATAIDKHGNMSERKFTVTIKEKPVANTNSSSNYDNENYYKNVWSF